MKEGEIYRVEIPVSGGREQAGLRPAIIAQAAGAERLPTVLVVPLTSKIKAASFPFTFNSQNDLSFLPSVIRHPSSGLYPRARLFEKPCFRGIVFLIFLYYLSENP